MTNVHSRPHGNDRPLRHLGAGLVVGECCSPSRAAVKAFRSGWCAAAKRALHFERKSKTSAIVAVGFSSITQ